MRPSFGWQIKAARVALGLTLDDVAEAAGLNRDSVHRAENAPPRRMPVFPAERITNASEQKGACSDAAHDGFTPSLSVGDGCSGGGRLFLVLSGADGPASA